MSSRFQRVLERSCKERQCDLDLASVIAARQLYCLHDLNYRELMGDDPCGPFVAQLDQILGALSRHHTRLVAIHEIAAGQPYKIGNVVTADPAVAMGELHNHAVATLSPMLVKLTRSFMGTRGQIRGPHPGVATMAERIHTAILVIEARLAVWRWNGGAFGPPPVESLGLLGSNTVNATARARTIANLPEIDSFSLSHLLFVY